MRVLIADDSDLIRDRLQQMLRQYGQVDIVGSFDNGTGALEALHHFRPDLAIIDYKMPGLSGLEVLKGIRKESTAIKIVILTFYSSDYYRQLAMQNGADYFFSKADDFEKISLVVEEMMENAT
ncbi:MAG: response regulator transcription factor [Bacteroidales bacterium]|nr:response regulator transcription factor [Bacteroidales bacterium]